MVAAEGWVGKSREGSCSDAVVAHYIRHYYGADYILAYHLTVSTSGFTVDRP